MHLQIKNLSAFPRVCERFLLTSLLNAASLLFLSPVSMYLLSMYWMLNVQALNILALYYSHIENVLALNISLHEWVDVSKELSFWFTINFNWSHLLKTIIFTISLMISFSITHHFNFTPFFNFTWLLNFTWLKFHLTFKFYLNLQFHITLQIHLFI